MNKWPGRSTAVNVYMFQSNTRKYIKPWGKIKPCDSNYFIWNFKKAFQIMIFKDDHRFIPCENQKELSCVFPELGFSFEHLLTSFDDIKGSESLCPRCVFLKHFFPVCLCPKEYRSETLLEFLMRKKFQNCSRESGKWIISTSLT